MHIFLTIYLILSVAAVIHHWWAMKWGKPHIGWIIIGFIFPWFYFPFYFAVASYMKHW